jgi:thioredoxin-related protein
MSSLARLLRALVIAVALIAPFLMAGPAAQARDAMDDFFQPFLGDFQAELADAKRTGKQGIMVMYHFEECRSCQWMKANILSRQDVQAYYRERFVLLPLDTLGALTITDFQGREWTEKEFARSVPVKATPTFIFYDLDGRPVAKHVGRIKDPAEFMLLADYVASGTYRTMSFAQYRQSKQGKKGS